MQNPYRQVVIVLLVATLLGAVSALVGGFALGNKVLLDVGVVLWLSGGIVAGSLNSENKWARPVAVAGAVALTLIALSPMRPVVLSPLRAASAAALCLVAAGLAATAARYLGELDPTVLPDAPGLCRGARVMTWILVFAAVSVGLEWAQQDTGVRIIHVLMVVLDAAVCRSLFLRPGAVADIGALSLLGTRPNILASILDAGERQLGIDLRSTWALTVVRRGIEPLVIGLFLVGWLSTSLTVVGVEQQGLVERLGVPRGGPPLSAGLHIHWPWPVDRVYRVPVQRVQSVDVGHPGAEAEGPENVLWAVEHAANEYSLVLGNGRDLITIDASLQFRIIDARAWRYHCQNPADALRALALRAVMRNTVDRTLADALSENVATVTEQMQSMVQRDADALGLGVQVVGFTVGGMHPPVPVAPAYEAVVSAEIHKGTAVVNAQAFRNQALPNAEASVLADEATARGDSAQAIALAAGEAWSFRALESQYRAAPEDYVFRRRLEKLEKDLAGRGFTVVDSRFIRDGGELWLTP